MVSNLPSIPPVGYFHFTLAQEESPLNHLQVGVKIKDQEDGAMTSEKIAYEKASLDAESSYQADMVYYQQKHDLASVKAKEAKEAVKKPRQLKVAAITALTLSILASIGVAIATAVTGTLPLLFIAIPFVIAIAPSGYFTNKYSTIVDKLDKIISAPKKMPVPQKAYVKPYKAEEDLDLRMSRITAMNALAQKSIKELAQSKWSTTQMLNYGLLDHVVKLSPSKRSTFYAKTFQLIAGYQSVTKTKDMNEANISYKYTSMKSGLEQWKYEQDCQISQREHDLSQREDLHDRERYRDSMERRPPTLWNVLDSVDMMSSRSSIESYKQKIAITYGQKFSDITHWYRESQAALAGEYRAVLQTIEARYLKAKTEAIT